MKKIRFLLFGNMPKNIPHLIGVAGCFLTLLTVALPVSAELPIMPGFEVQLYAKVPTPATLSFEPSGVLYAGNGTFEEPAKIYRIDVGGSPVREYGEFPLWDPDAVVFDSVGTISGQPGSVLVGGIYAGSPTGYLAAILPDESIITIFGPDCGLVNPSDMLFDKKGRLLIADAFAAKVFYSDDGVTLNTLIENVYLAGTLALDKYGNIYLSRNEYDEIRIYSPDGTLLNDSFVTGLDIRGMDFGPGSPPWDGHLFAVSYEGKLYRIDELGTVTEIGTGFNDSFRTPDLEFGPDGALYVSATSHDTIYRIVPTCEGYCDEQSPAGCWCDDLCQKYGDCCPDYYEVCGGPPPDSCEGRCGQQAPAGCWCDDLCKKYGNCCPDYEEKCLTCEGYCGEQSPGGCWCDDLCEKYGDCCPDYYEMCL